MFLEIINFEILTPSGFTTAITPWIGDTNGFPIGTLFGKSGFTQ